MNKLSTSRDARRPLLSVERTMWRNSSVDSTMYLAGMYFFRISFRVFEISYAGVPTCYMIGRNGGSSRFL